MPGTLILKPIQCTLTSKSSQTLHDIFVVAYLGDEEYRTEIAKMKGDSHFWKEKSSLEVRVNYEGVLHFEIKDADKKEPGDFIGNFKIDLDVLQNNEHAIEWYDIYYKNKVIGKIQMESTYQRDKNFKKQKTFGNATKPEYRHYSEGPITSH